MAQQIEGLLAKPGDGFIDSNRKHQCSGKCWGAREIPFHGQIIDSATCWRNRKTAISKLIG